VEIMAHTLLLMVACLCAGQLVMRVGHQNRKTREWTEKANRMPLKAKGLKVTTTGKFRSIDGT